MSSPPGSGRKLQAALIRILTITILALLLGATPSSAQSGTIEEITVYGLVQMTEEAFLHALTDVSIDTRLLTPPDGP